jgi:molecular chaperone HtpG
MERFNDYDKPIKMIQTSVEGKISYKGLLFIPSHTPFNYYDKNYEKGLSLYSNGVLIMDKCGDLLPDYFAFVKGVIDSEDLPLNISRETLQESSSLKLIEKNIDSKIIKELETMQSDDREKYISFFNTFGTPIKYGVYDNFGENKDKLKDLVMFYSNNEDKLITLKEYVSNMKENQDKIYYASGSSIEKVKQMPQVDQVKDKGYDILLLTEYVDEFCLTALAEYDNHKFVNIEKDDLDLETKEEKENTKKINEESKDMLAYMKESLNDEVVDVKFTNKISSHPVYLSTEGAMSTQMEKVFNAMPVQTGEKARLILEINEKHPIAEKIKSLFESDKEELKKYTKILYSEARLIDGLPIDNPTEISNLICELISK